MSKFIVQGGTRLQGEIVPQGAKNEALQIICATLLTPEKVTLHNVPEIVDIIQLIDMLRAMGVEVEKIDDKSYTFCARDIDLDYLRSEQTQTKIRQNIHDTSYRMLTYEINSLESCDPGRLYASEVETLFRECIDRMPGTTREVFLANRFRNMTYQEIAEERGMSVRQVTSEMQSALHLLRLSLKDYLPLALLLLLNR